MHINSNDYQIKATNIETRLRQLGAVNYNIKLPESKALIEVIKNGEDINGVVYGKYSMVGNKTGRGVIVVTSKRVIIIDKKPMFTQFDELSFRVISGVIYSKAGPSGTITLSTRSGDIKIRTFNQKCAKTFVSAIEAILESNFGY